MEVEFMDIDKRNAWGTVFQEIRNESNNFSYVIKDAKKSENKNLNRYRDVNPFDHSRVHLQRGDKDYINASLVSVPSAERSYILTQGPLPGTTGHFWLMVWEQKSKAILMLNRVIEKNTVKCHQYWPVGSENGGKEELSLSDVGLKVTFICEKKESYYTVREFMITDLENQDSRKVIQFHYTTWPDFGVPQSPAAFLNFLFAVRKSDVLNSTSGPAVVHCSAGIGRSGTFCLVDSCLVLIRKSNDSNSINIRQRLLEMRHYRMGLIQTPDQLRFSYLAIIEGAKTVLSLKPSDNYYVPLQNDIQEKCVLDNVQSSNETISNNLDVSPPPLPPRSICNFENVSPTPCTFIGTNSKCNGDLLNNLPLTAGKEEIEDESNKNSLGEKHVINQKDGVSKSAGDRLQHSPGTSCDSLPASTVTESISELRKRARKEREEKTATIVQNIKKKQKESELWGKRRSIIKISLGLVLIIGIGYIVYKNYSKG